MPGRAGCTENERLVILETQMREVVGNGQPGRLGKVETEVKTHSRLLYIGIGGLWVLQIVFGAKLFAFQR
jgi:hypothetical protein